MSSKVVLITGGSSGIGKAIGSFLKAKGHVVYGTARNPFSYPEFSAFPLVALDVRKPESIQTAVAQVIQEQGRLDVLVNNAGVGITGPIEETPLEEIRNTFDINFNGPLQMIQAVLPQMRGQGSGTIINITSIAGYMGLPYRGIYSASKGALELATEALRMETKDFGIRFANLAPGDFATNIAAGRYHAPVLDGSPYKEPYGNTLKAMDEHVDQGGDPVEVAQKVWQIITSDSPKIHYKVGQPMQKFSIVLKRLLPDKVYEKMLLNHYKL